MPRYSPNQIVKAIRSADSAFKSKDYQKAIIRYKKATAMDPKQPIIWFRMGISYYFSGNLIEAVKSYERAFIIEKHPEIAINMGLAYLGLKNYEKAEKSFNQALQFDKSPKNSKTKGEINLQLGRTLLAKGDLKKSLKSLERSEACENPPKLLINYFKGEVYLLQNKLDQAVSSYNNVLELDDSFKDAVIRLVIIYIDKEDKENALKLLTSYLKKYPKASDLWNIRGDLHNSVNDFVNAYFAYSQSLKFTESIKDSLTAQIGMIKSSLGQEKFVEAEKLIKQVLERDNKNLDGLVLSAESLWLQGKKQEAIEFFEDNVMFYYSNNEAVQLKIAEYYLQVKNYENAEKILEKLLKIHPDDYNININLSQIYTKEGYLDLNKAKQFLDKTQTLAKSDSQIAHVFFTYGKIDYKKENYKEAEKYFKKSLKIEPSHIYSGLFLGKTLAKQTRKNDLTNFLQSFFKSNPKYKDVFIRDNDLNQYIKEMEP